MSTVSEDNIFYTSNLRLGRDDILPVDAQCRFDDFYLLFQVQPTISHKWFGEDDMVTTHYYELGPVRNSSVFLNREQVNDHNAAMTRMFYMLSQVNVPLTDQLVEILRKIIVIMRGQTNPTTTRPVPIMVEIKAISPQFDEEEEDNESEFEYLDEYEVEDEYEDLWPERKPAEKSAVEVLEKVRMGTEEEEMVWSTCMICLEMFCTEEITTKMPCSHLFHGDCIVHWLQESHFCPICRFEMPTNGEYN